MSREPKKGAAAAGPPSSSAARGRSSARQQSARSSRAVSATSAEPAATPEAGPSTRRQSRRRSLDPYSRPPPVADEAAAVEKEQPQPIWETAPEEPAEGEASVEQEAGGQDELQAEDDPPSDSRNFELVVVQQPEIGAEAGMDKVTLGRLPIVPAPVVQVVVRNADGEPMDAELPYLFCSCSLRQEDGAAAVELAQPADAAANDTEEEFSALIGNLVRNAHRVPDLDGNPGSFFVFEDMSVRTTGKFTLEFRLGEANRPKSPKLAAVVSDSFEVVPWKDYPGRPAADTVPELSRHLHEHGVPMYIPPLVLNNLEPPPPGSNPFEPGMAPPNLGF